ncbi:hypothetical protein GOP47_0030430 [Adiantum capillus-veneris]|nr:hypothetical protein GOP47_0030430 [Adiantum capillus-veneris]
MAQLMGVTAAGAVAMAPSSLPAFCHTSTQEHLTNMPSALNLSQKKASSGGIPSVLNADDMEFSSDEDQGKLSYNRLVFATAPSEEKVEEATKEPHAALHLSNLAPSALEEESPTMSLMENDEKEFVPAIVNQKKVADRQLPSLSPGLGLLVAGSSSVYPAFQSLQTNSKVQVFCTPTGSKKYANLLRECISHEALKEGMQAHSFLLRDNIDDDRFLGNILVEMYYKCGALEEARWMFDRLDSPNVYSWNNIIAAYAHHRCEEEALHLFHEMLSYVEPNNFTFNIVLGVCANLEALDEGKFVHNQVVYYGHDNDIDIQTTLLNVFEKCGRTNDALRVFNKLHTHTVVSATVMIAAYVREKQFKEALMLFRYIQKTGIEVDGFLLSTTLGACCGQEELEEGRWIHCLAIQGGYVSDIVIETALIIMYGNCGCSDGAETVFQKSVSRSVVLFTSLITAYVQLEHSEKALQIFWQMQHRGIDVNEVTFVSILGACADGPYLEYGQMLYHLIINHGSESDLVVGSAIVNMFGKCGCPEDAHNVFDKLSKRNVVTWNALITSYVQLGDGNMALKLYRQLLSENLRPSEITYVYALAACGILSYLEEGKSIHISITKSGLESHEKVANALVSMYGKSGGLMEALAIFNKLPEQDVVSWNSLVSAYTYHGRHKEALDFFEQMQKGGVKPDGVTFISVLSACSHAGLIVEGLQYLFAMSQDYHIEPTIEHYGCVLDLLSRAGQLEKAEDFIDKMPILPDSVAWRSFLTACKLHGASERGRHTAENVIDSNAQEGPLYVLLANMHVADEV